MVTVKFRGTDNTYRPPRVEITFSESARLVKNLKDVDLAADEKFRWDYYTFHRNNAVKAYFEKVFDCKLKACYTTDKKTAPKKNDLTWGCTHMVFYAENGTISYFNNSEWAAVELSPKSRDGK